MAWIFVGKDGDESGEMRSQMRRNMRGGYRHYGDTPMMRENYDKGYRQGYKHGWEDKEDEEEYRRSRDARGRYE